MPEVNTITAIILAGGKSSRMKTDKGLVYFGGKMLVEQVIGSLRKITPAILIITTNPAYRQFGYPCLEDEIKEKGPLGGIYTGLSHSSTQKILVVGCDMPFLTKNVVQELINQSSDEDVLFSEHLGKAEPLCAIYDRNCIPHFKLMLEQNKLKITDATTRLKTRVINFDVKDWFRGNEFTNINSPEELKKYS